MGSPFGDALKHRRESLDLKMHHVAAELRVDVSTVSMWEAGTMGPSLSRADEVARFMDIPLHRLMEMLAETARYRAAEAAKKRAAKIAAAHGKKGRGKKRAA